MSAGLPSRLLVLLLFVPAALTAQDDAAAPQEPKEIGWKDSVVVSASRYEQNERDTAAKVSVVERDEIESAAVLTVDDLLRRVPGFSLFRRSSSLVSHPTSQGVSLRGIAPSGVSRTLVLVDGIPLNDPFGGWVYWSRVPLESVDRIEVVRGGVSNLWGNSALGGVIQLFTRDAGEDVFDLAAEAGERGTAHVDASLGEVWNRGHLQLFASAFQTDGYPVLEAPYRGAIDVPAFSENQTFSATASFDLSESVLLSVNGNVFHEERGNGTPLTGNDTDVAAGWARVVAIAGSHEVRGTLTVQNQGFASTFSSQAEDRSLETPALDQFDVPSDALGLGVQWLHAIEGQRSSHRLVAGAEAQNIDGATNENFFFSAGAFVANRHAGGDQELLGVFLQDTLAIAERWQLQLGARVDRWRTSNGQRLETTIADGSIRRLEVAPDRDETQISPRASLLFAPTDALHWRFSAYESFRAPTINELFRPFRVRNDITEANAALQPETLQGLEAGFDLRRARLHLEGGLFWNEIEDPIANVTVGLGPGSVAPCGFVPGGGTCRQRQNLGRSRVQGIEGDLRYRAGGRWRLRASYLFSDTEILEAPNQPALEGLEIAQVPKQQLTLGATFSGSRSVDLDLQARIVDDQFEDDLNERVLDGFAVLDLGVSRRLNDRLALFVSVENVFDEQVGAGITGEGLVTIGAPRLVHGGFRLHIAR